MGNIMESIGWNALLIVTTALLVVIGAILIRRAREDLMDQSGADDHDLIASFREAYERGEMDLAEYQRILEAVQAQRTPEARSKPPGPPKGSEGTGQAEVGGAAASAPEADTAHGDQPDERRLDEPGPD